MPNNHAFILGAGIAQLVERPTRKPGAIVTCYLPTAGKTETIYDACIPPWLKSPTQLHRRTHARRHTHIHTRACTWYSQIRERLEVWVIWSFLFFFLEGRLLVFVCLHLFLAVAGCMFVLFSGELGLWVCYYIKDFVVWMPYRFVELVHSIHGTCCAEPTSLSWFTVFHFMPTDISFPSRRIVNDSLRTDVPLLYPPYLIALGKQPS